MKFLLLAFILTGLIFMIIGCTEWNDTAITIKVTNEPLPKLLDTLGKLAPLNYYIDTNISEHHMRPVTLSVNRSSIGDVMLIVAQQEPDLSVSATSIGNIPIPIIRISKKVK